MGVVVTNWLDRLPNNWKPISVAQKAALDCPANVLLFGGAAGASKSETILVDALKYYQQPKYNGIIFRKTYPEIEFLIDRTRTLYSQTGGTFYEAARQWRWPWGASLEFRHLDKDKDVYKYQGQEYSYVAWDESTHFKEFQIRYLLNSRMRSTEGIPLRMRLATNPGNLGHSFHKEIFHGPKCVHCIIAANPENPKWLPGSRKPFHLYSDARWPSDKIPMEHTTMFIPGRVKDHTLFGVDGGEYAKKLRGLPVALRQALLEGCWEAFEGQFFDCFDFNTHIIKRDQVQNKDWWPYWVGIDYGFGHAAAAYLFTKSPSGIVYVLDEYIIHRRKAVDFAEDLKKMWGHYNPKAWYLGRDTFDHDGADDFSKAELMSQATGIYYEMAYNERASGAMLIYTLLQDYKLFITENCEILPKALQTRTHSEKNAEDIEKVKTEDEDDAYDACLVADTQVATTSGPIAIQSVLPGAFVQTRSGPRRVKYAWKSGHNRPCLTLKLSNGQELTGTRNHPIFVQGRGFIPLDSITPADILETRNVAVSVIGITSAGKHDVYNLEVEGEHEYFANGILTHNCRYGIASYINPTSKPQGEVLQEKFQSEWSQDPTVAMIQFQMWQQQQTSANGPINYRSGRGSTSKPMSPMFWGNPPGAGGKNEVN